MQAVVLDLGGALLNCEPPVEDALALAAATAASADELIPETVVSGVG